MPASTSFQVEPEHQFHRLPAVLARYGTTQSSLYRWMALGRFPRGEKLGPNTVVWRERTLREFDANPMGWAEHHGNGA